MLFPTVEFAIFFPVVLALSWLLMPRQKLWKPYIIIASYVFYAAANPKFCLLLAGITLGNQAAAKLIAAAGTERRRKWITGVAVGLDLALLGVFKYYAFFVQDWADLLDSFHLGAPLPLLTIALPIGVSFFTFQAITYVVDVKRGDAEPASTTDVAIYLSFFPHLVAGPIVRASEFLPQLKAPRDPNKVAVGAGLALVGLGVIKKVLIADYLARVLVDPVFAVPQAYAAPDALLAAYGYAVQIYCDFSGYTDIAIGLALLMGFIFPQNFNRPYRATGFRDFWRRWHMTLSRFLIEEQRELKVFGAGILSSTGEIPHSLFSNDALTNKIKNILQNQRLTFTNGSHVDSKSIAEFLYKIDFVIARKEQENGVVSRFYFDQNRFLQSQFVDYGYKWEIHPAYRWALTPGTPDAIFEQIELGN